MQNDPEVQQIVKTYQLGLPRMPISGRSGELLGRGTGSSLEFQEYREYFPGDDIRHLDWAAYARSDVLMVRLYRDEISPKTEILLDASRSMTTGGTTKPFVTRQIAATLALLSARLGGKPQIIPLDDSRPLKVMKQSELTWLTDYPFDGIASPVEILDGNLLPASKKSLRIVISDFLFPHDPASLIRRLAVDTGSLWVIQVLNAWEADPTVLGGRRLIDAETRSECNLLIDRRRVAAYRDRLAALQSELARECRRAHATFATLIADRGLIRLCREDLSYAEILRTD
ncbi:MAG: DUF58 domain-containing protein [Planctomycetota bacterium]|nr:DUF58 domain-containing protein [Planctomycetota bacterium]MDA1211537.1 DUF58 domain-containing protein [Planctomycetota bacterium]